MAKPVKKTTPAAKKTTAAAVKTDVFAVTRTYTPSGTLNSSVTETVETVKLPVDALISKVSVTKGLAAKYGELKASVSITVPCVLGEETEAGAYAAAKVDELLGDIGAHVAEAQETDTAGSSASDDDDGDDEDGDDEDEDDEDGDDEDEGDDVTADDINAMDRKQLEAYLAEYAEACEEQGEENIFEEIDASEYKKTKAGLAEFKEAVIALLGDDEDGDDEDGDEEDEDDEDGDGYTAEELDEMDTADLKKIYKEWEIGKYPKTDKLARKGILKFQEEQEEDDE